ncbi:MAG: hypothetical protein IKU54_05840 [Oscillospiraceae bacterium]|nr:hypothetical protein [Oscillospiraceae bacterium]
MARNPKPVKIKRHKNSMGSSAQNTVKAKKVLSLVVAVVLVVAVGFMLGKPLLNLITAGGNSGDSSAETVVSQPEIIQTEQTEDGSVADSSEETQLPPDVQIETNRVYYYATASQLSGQGNIATVVNTMKAKGATHLVFDAKNMEGYVHYTSSNQYASQLPATVLIDIPGMVSQLKAAGITPVATIYTFKDKKISDVERSTAVMYQGTDTRWLDSSAALGGKAWANPASKLMQDYIIALTDELMAMGITEFIYAGFSTPTGYSLDKRDFGATTEQVLANMKSLIGTLEAKISAKGGYSAWQFEYSAVKADGDYAQYIVHPYQLGAENMIITASGGDIDAAAVATLTADENQEDIGEITLWLVDGLNNEETRTLGSYFVS